jgi:iron complex outermembrane receptor protein
VRKFELSLASLAVGGASLVIGMDAAPAQTVAQADSAGDALISEVIVTARKRDETLHEVPLSISVFSSQNLEEFGASALEDIAVRTPGFQYVPQGGQRPGRVHTSLRFRGMDINSTNPTQQLATMFIDGIPVAGGMGGIGLEDLERVEVIKGPQSAFFGRSTFGGAVNYITKNPNATDYQGRLSAKMAQQGLYDISLAHEGPIISDKLAYRITGRLYHTDGPYSSVDGGKLGEENTEAIQLTLRATPTENLTARARVMVYQDDDGVPAGAFIGPGLRNCFAKNGGPLFTPPPGYTGVGPVDYFCGELPMAPNSMISNNTMLSERGRQIYIYRDHPLFDHPVWDEVPHLNHMGLKREALRTSLAIDYTFPGSGIVLSSNSGYNDERFIAIMDLDKTMQPDYFSGNARKTQDFFQELRLASPSDQRAQWMVGLSYYRQHHVSPSSVTWLQPLDVAFREGGSDKTVETPAVFASFNYSFTDTLNLSLEGRYQEDKVDQGLASNGTPMKATFTNFMPRAILQYQPTSATNLYATYAQGNKPGDFNSSVIVLNDDERQQVRNQTGGGNFVPEEELTNYELGWKQLWLDNRLTTNLAVYYMQWENQQTTVPAFIYNPAHPNANPITGERPIQMLVAAGKTDLWGLELDATYRLGRSFEAGMTFGWAASEYKKFYCGFVERFTGSTDCAGNHSPRFPEFSGSAHVRYGRDLTERWSGFIRGEAIYSGKAYIDESNLAWTKAYTTVQLRAGLESDALRIEFWVNNLFDERYYAAAVREADFTNLLNFNEQGATLTPGFGRQAGVTLVYQF